MRIDFLNPEYHEGLNSTVRKGPRQVVPGEKVEMYLTGSDTPVAYGVVRAVHIIFSEDLSDDMLIYQHSLGTQYTDGLWAAMERAYGHSFAGEDIITIIYYEV